MGEGLSFWAHRMRGLIFKCPRIVGNMGLKETGAGCLVCVYVCVEVCWSLLEHTSSFLLRTFSPSDLPFGRLSSFPSCSGGSLLHREAHNLLSELVTVTPAGHPRRRKWWGGGGGGA